MRTDLEQVDRDNALLLAWREGDDEAGNQLVRRHFKSVYRFFRTKVPDVADDLAQATFLACVEGRERYRGDAAFRIYVLAIARKQLFRHFRRHRRDLVNIEPGYHSVADLAPSPSKIVAQSERDALLIGALQTIPVDDQIALELRYWEGCSVADVAEVFSIPVGTAKRRLYEARERLRDALVRVATPRVATANR